MYREISHRHGRDIDGWNHINESDIFGTNQKDELLESVDSLLREGEDDENEEGDVPSETSETSDTSEIEGTIDNWFSDNIPDVSIDRISTGVNGDITAVDIEGDVSLDDFNDAPEYIVVHKVSGSILSSPDADYNADTIGRVFLYADNQTKDKLPKDVVSVIDDINSQTTVNDSVKSLDDVEKRIFEDDSDSAETNEDDEVPVGDGKEDKDSDEKDDKKEDDKEDGKEDDKEEKKDDDEEDVPLSGIKITFKDGVDLDEKKGAMTDAGIPEDMLTLDKDDNTIVVDFNGDEEILGVLKDYLKDKENIDLEEEIGGEISTEDDSAEEKAGKKEDDTDDAANGDINDILNGMADGEDAKDGGQSVKDETEKVK